MSKKLLRRPAVEAKTGCSRSSLYELIAAGKFPKPIRISANRVAWPEEDVDAWIASVVRASRAAAPLAA